MTPLKQLAEQGQSVWIDYLSRNFIDERTAPDLPPGYLPSAASGNTGLEHRI